MLKKFVAGNHLCFFSKGIIYKKMTVNEVLKKKDPEYIIWCYENLKHLRFTTGLEERIKQERNRIRS